MESIGVYGFLETFAFQGSGPRATLALGSGGFKVQSFGVWAGLRVFEFYDVLGVRGFSWWRYFLSIWGYGFKDVGFKRLCGSALKVFLR